jgi:hypothetical protein
MIRNTGGEHFKAVKRPFRVTSKKAQVETRHDLHSKIIKITTGLGIHVVED